MTHEGQISEQVPNPFADGQWKSTSYYARYESPTLRSRRAGYVPIIATAAALALAGIYYGNASAQGNCSDLLAGGTYETTDAENAVYACTEPDGSQGYLRPRTEPTLDCEALDAQWLRSTVNGTYDRDTCVTNSGETQRFTYSCNQIIGSGWGGLHPDGDSLCTDSAGAPQPLTLNVDLSALPQPANDVAPVMPAETTAAAPQDQYTVAERAGDIAGVVKRSAPIWGLPFLIGAGALYWRHREGREASQRHNASVARAQAEERQRSAEARQMREDQIRADQLHRQEHPLDPKYTQLSDSPATIHTRKIVAALNDLDGRRTDSAINKLGRIERSISADPQLTDREREHLLNHIDNARRDLESGLSSGEYR